MSRDMVGRMWLGLGLIGLGIAFILVQWIGWERVWPVLPLLGGLACLVWFMVSGRRDGGLVFLGVAASLVGLFFFGFTLGYWEWAEMADLWPVFPLIGGVAFLCQFVAERGRDAGTLGVGCAALVVGVAGLAFTAGLVTGNILRFWPVLLILIGVISLVGGLLRVAGRR